MRRLVLGDGARMLGVCGRLEVEKGWVGLRQCLLTDRLELSVVRTGVYESVCRSASCEALTLLKVHLRQVAQT